MRPEEGNVDIHFIPYYELNQISFLFFLAYTCLQIYIYIICTRETHIGLPLSLRNNNEMCRTYGCFFLLSFPILHPTTHYSSSVFFLFISLWCTRVDWSRAEQSQFCSASQLLPSVNLLACQNHHTFFLILPSLLFPPFLGGKPSEQLSWRQNCQCKSDLFLKSLGVHHPFCLPDRKLIPRGRLQDSLLTSSLHSCVSATPGLGSFLYFPHWDRW